MNRRESFRNLTTQEFDLLIIGGGITGAGILLDAVTRGLTCALVEMQDFAAGTSSRSTKLIHGGLRYLKQLEFRLVAQVGRERRVVYENGPHVTTPVWMLLPIMDGGSPGPWLTSFGIYVYDRLAAVKHTERRKMLSRAEALQVEPLLNPNGLKGAGYYVEYRTDDARLTLEVLKEAVARGAIAVNYTKVVDYLREDGEVRGVSALDVWTGEKVHIGAKVVVNASGPWVDDLRGMDGHHGGPTLHWTKGTHIVIDHRRLPLRNPVYFDILDGRMIFAIPRDGKTYIGTTDTDYAGDLAHPHATAEDIRYLLDAAHHAFPSVHLDVSDVESTWAGIRPLVHEEGKSPSEISRKEEILDSPSGLITIAGGKLTGYRRMAEDVIDRVVHRLESRRSVDRQGAQLHNGSIRSYGPCVTRTIPISGGHVGGPHHFPAYVERMVTRGIEVGLTAEEAAWMARRYGSNVEHLHAIVQRHPEDDAAAGMTAMVYAPLRYAIDAEMVMTPSDFFIRRTGALYFDIHWVRRWKEPVIDYMRQLFGWDETVEQLHRHHLEARIAEATYGTGGP